MKYVSNIRFGLMLALLSLSTLMYSVDIPTYKPSKQRNAGVLHTTSGAEMQSYESGANGSPSTTINTGTVSSSMPSTSSSFQTAPHAIGAARPVIQMPLEQDGLTSATPNGNRTIRRMDDWDPDIPDYDEPDIDPIGDMPILLLILLVASYGLYQKRRQAACQ